MPGCLRGRHADAVQTHLGDCAECASEAERLTGSVASFNVASRLWAQRKAATHPRLTLQVADGEALVPAAAQRWAAAACAVAVAVALGIGGTAASTFVPCRPRWPLISPAGTPVSAPTLKSDNALLSAIDGEVSAQESVPSASVYSIGDSERTAKKAPQERR